jgi:hypothetical protein
LLPDVRFLQHNSIEDLTQMKEFLNDLKQEVRELREEYLELESEQNG